MKSPNSLESPVHPFIILHIHSAEAQSPAVAPPSEGRHISDPPEAAVRGGAERAAAVAIGSGERERVPDRERSVIAEKDARRQGKRNTCLVTPRGRGKPPT